MKTRNIKYLLFIVCGLALGALSACQLDEPGPIPQEELFLRAFIMQYGLIDPQQDWNMAERESVTVETGSQGADLINVYVKVGAKYFRVAAYADVTGTVTIPIDVPDSSKELYLEIDGKLYPATIGGTVNLASLSRAGSRDVIDFGSYFSRDNWNVVVSESETIYKSTLELPVVLNTDDSNTYPSIKCTHYLYLPNNGTTVTNVSAADGNDYAFKLTSSNPKAHMQAHSVADEDKLFIVRFKATASTASTFYFLFDDGKGGADFTVTGTQTYEVLMPLISAGSWPQFMFQWINGGDVTISELSFEEFSSGDMAWLLVAEDLGATDDFDFNDVIIRIEAVAVNDAYLNLKSQWWQVIEDEDEHIVLHAPGRNPSSRAHVSYTSLKIDALAAGGILDSYLHFRASSTEDYVITPGNYDLTGTAKPVAKASASENHEWHKWFNDSHASSMVNSRNMLWTGLNDNIETYSATLIVPGTFSMSTYSQIFSDEDGATDDVSDNKTQGSSGDIYDSNNKLSEWANAENYNIRGFYLTVGTPTGQPTANSTGYYLGASKAGGAPQMFLIPDVGSLSASAKGESKWHWPRERVPIVRVYPRFTDWVNNHLNSDWFLDAPVTEGVYDREWEHSVTPYISRTGD